MAPIQVVQADIGKATGRLKGAEAPVCERLMSGRFHPPIVPGRI